MLDVQGLSYYIGRKKIADSISVRFPPGVFHMILGPNGSGKSTFLKLFSGELKPSEGKILYEGVDLSTLRKEAVAQRRAVMSQQPELHFPVTVEDVVMMGRYPHFTYQPTKKDREICQEASSIMRIEALGERNYLTLSGGEKQRVQFARALAQIWEKPTAALRYFLLDEPLANLDVNYQQEFLRIARKILDENTIMIAVMHDLNLAAQCGDQLYFLKNGRLVIQGTPEQTLTSESLASVFEVEAKVIPNPVNGKPLIIFT